MSQPSRPHPEAVPVPPDEQFWQKYSPNFEFPISTVGTVFVHVLAVVFLFLTLTYFAGPGQPKNTPPIEVVVVDDPSGIFNGQTGGGSLGGERDRVVDDPVSMEAFPELPEVRLADAQAEITPFVPELARDPQAMREVARSEAFKNFARANADIRKGLMDGLRDKPGPGGPGDGTGDGAGGPGSGGDGEGEKTVKRMLRWTINFETSDGRNYLNQLDELGAVIVVPQPPDWRTAHVIRDLKNPNNGRPEDLSQFNSMFFSDDRPDSVRTVARALNLGFIPPSFTAIFPKTLEEQLADLEKKHRGLPEEKIFSTTFKIVTAGGKVVMQDGKPRVVVLSQQPVGGRFGR